MDPGKIKREKYQDLGTINMNITSSTHRYKKGKEKCCGCQEPISGKVQDNPWPHKIKGKDKRIMGQGYRSYDTSNGYYKDMKEKRDRNQVAVDKVGHVTKE